MQKLNECRAVAKLHLLASMKNKSDQYETYSRNKQVVKASYTTEIQVPQSASFDSITFKSKQEYLHESPKYHARVCTQKYPK